MPYTYPLHFVWLGGVRVDNSRTIPFFSFKTKGVTLDTDLRVRDCICQTSTEWYYWYLFKVGHGEAGGVVRWVPARYTTAALHSHGELLLHADHTR